MPSTIPGTVLITLEIASTARLAARGRLLRATTKAAAYARMHPSTAVATATAIELVSVPNSSASVKMAAT